MTRFRGMAFVLLLATLAAGCDDANPLAPTPPVVPVTPTVESVTITVEAPYPVNIRPKPQHPGIPGVTVICTAGCEGQQTDTTDRDGKVTFTGAPPLTIRAEKLEYIPIEQRVFGSDTVVLGHEWPPETADSFRRLRTLRETSLPSAGLLVILEV